MSKSVISSENSSLTVDIVDEAWPLLAMFVKTDSNKYQKIKCPCVYKEQGQASCFCEL